jgi:protein TonB
MNYKIDRLLMKRRVVVLCILVTMLLPGYLAAQTEPVVTKYFDENHMVTTDQSLAAFYETVQENNGKYMVKSFFKKSNKIEMIAECTQYKPYALYDGRVTWYYESGAIEVEGTYRSGSPIGTTKNFYPNGAQKALQIHRGEKVYYAQYWTEDGNQQLKNGTGTLFLERSNLGYNLHIQVRDSLMVSAYRVSEADTVYLIVEEQATFPGGMKELYSRIGKTLVYPKEARRHKVEGRVFIQFTVKKNGELKDAKIIRGIGAGCDEEAISGLLRQGNWIPGKVDGKPVDSKFNLAIIFKLN